MTGRSRDRARWDVVGLGANSVDFVHVLPGYPQPVGSLAKMRIARSETLVGGQTLTAMCACVQLGLRAQYTGVIGADHNGRRVRGELEQRGMDVSELSVHDAQSQFAVILVDETTGDRIVLWDRDEKLLMRDREIPGASIASTRLLHVDDVDQGAAIRAARIAREIGVPVTSDIDRITDRTDELVAAVTIPIFAEHVPPHMTGENDPERALRKLRETHDGLLCVTLGDRGALALDGDTSHYAPAFRVNALDTTGAGDVFRAGFIRALLHGLPAGEILRFANAAAAVSCTRLGALGGIPALDEVARLLESGQVRA